jgi:predicted negative regulator of RcsB-dependent stress response
VEVYLSEEERVEALKKWWKENSASVIGGIALGLAVVYGWKAWEGAQVRKAEEASGLFQQLIKTAEDKNSRDPALNLSDKIIHEFQGTAYANFAALYQARLRVESGDLPGARKVLSDLLESTSDENEKLLIRLRLARVIQEQGDSAEALKLVENLKADELGSFLALYEELRGDLLLDLKRPADALAAYEKSRAAEATSPLLELKIRDLGGDQATPVKQD